MPIAITERNAINVQPLQQRAIAAQPRPMRIIYLQPSVGNFNQMPVAPVPAPTDCASRLMTNDAGFYIGLAATGLTGCVGAAAGPWIAHGLGYALTTGPTFAFGMAGATPGLACASGVALWGCTDGRK